MARRSQFRLLAALTIVWALWAGWSLLDATRYTLRVLDDAGAPIAAASVDINESQVGTSAEDGTIEVEWNRSSTVLEVSAAGHVPKTVTISERPDGAFEVVLKARFFAGGARPGRDACRVGRGRQARLRGPRTARGR